LLQREADNAVLRRAMLALVPAWLQADQCLTRSLDIEITAPLVPVPADSSEQAKWYGQISTPTVRLASLAASNCEVAAALRFMRMPWIASVEDGLVLGDLRYDREKELGFAEIVVTDQPNCPSLVPDWVEPRYDLLEQGTLQIGSPRSQP
jgi:inner membrane protein